MLVLCPRPSSAITTITSIRQTLIGSHNLVSLSITTSRKMSNLKWVRYCIQMFHCRIKYLIYIIFNWKNKQDNLKDIECCTPNGQFIDEDLVHPECNPIKIPQNDPFFSKFGRRCMSFVRSAPARRSDCRLGYAEQVRFIHSLYHTTFFH